MTTRCLIGEAGTTGVERLPLVAAKPGVALDPKPNIAAVKSARTFLGAVASCSFMNIEFSPLNMVHLMDRRKARWSPVSTMNRLKGYRDRGAGLFRLHEIFMKARRKNSHRGVGEQPLTFRPMLPRLELPNREIISDIYCCRRIN